MILFLEWIIFLVTLAGVAAFLYGITYGFYLVTTWLSTRHKQRKQLLAILDDAFWRTADEFCTATYSQDYAKARIYASLNEEIFQLCEEYEKRGML